MKILIFGATGGTGRQLVEQALAQGHTVTAFARDPAKVIAKHANLRVAQGNMLQTASIEAAVAGQDAVLSALGIRIPVLAWVAITIACQLVHHVVPLGRAANLAIAIGGPVLAVLILFRKTTALSDGTRNIVQAMEKMAETEKMEKTEKLGAKRFVCESSLGVGDSKWRLGLLFNLLVIPLFLRNVFADKARQEEIIRQSSLEWVIVRPTALTNGPRTGTYRTGSDIGHWLRPTKISRADVADFMLKQLTDSTYLRKSTGVAY